MKRAPCPARLRIEVVDGLDRLNEETGDQVDDIDDGQRLQQPVGGVLRRFSWSVIDVKVSRSEWS